MKVLCFIANTGQARYIPLFCMQPPCATLCFKDFCNPALPPLSCMQSQRPSPLTLHDDGLCPSSPIPQVYATLSIPIPGALCTSCHDCSLLFEFIFSLSCQELPLSPLQTYVHFSLPSHSRVPSVLPSEGGCPVTSYQTALFFIFLSFSWRKDSSGCMPGSSGKMGKMREGH